MTTLWEKLIDCMAVMTDADAQKTFWLDLCPQTERPDDAVGFVYVGDNGTQWCRIRDDRVVVRKGVTKREFLINAWHPDAKAYATTARWSSEVVLMATGEHLLYDVKSEMEGDHAE